MLEANFVVHIVCRSAIFIHCPSNRTRFLRARNCSLLEMIPTDDGVTQVDPLDPLLEVFMSRIFQDADERGLRIQILPFLLLHCLYCFAPPLCQGLRVAARHVILQIQWV
jgi:hypothetical protein